MGLFDFFKNKKRSLANLNEGINSGYLEHYIKATNDYLNGNLKSALNNIDKTIELTDIDDWKHYAFRANVYEDLKQYSKAIEDYKRAIHISEKNLGFVDVYAQYHQIGYCYLSTNNDEKAIENFTKALELKKQHPNSHSKPDLEGLDGGVLLGVPFKRIYNNRAEAFRNTKRFENAINDCKRSLSYDENYSNPYLNLAYIYIELKNENTALAMLQKSASLGNRTAINLLKKLQ